MARILLSTPDGQQVVELRAHNSLGRHPSNTIQLLDKIVSKEHCTIEQRGDQFVLRDLGSLNGTYINGERVVGEARLGHGDDIALGSTRARYDDGSGPVIAHPSPAAGPATPPQAPASPTGPQAGPPPAWQRAPQPATAPSSVGQPPSTVAGRGLEPHRVEPGFAPAQHSVAGPRGTGPMPVSPSPRAVSAVVAGAVPSGPPSGAGGSGKGAATATRIDVNDQVRAIGTQIAATKKFLPHEEIAHNPQQLAADYERLRLSYELSREIALERDLPSLLNKILQNIFRFVRADRGVIFLKGDGQLEPHASLRRDGTDAPISVSSTIMNHVVEERATVLTHDAAMDFASSKGKSMILHRISSAIVAPLLHDDEILGVLWLDSETLAQFQPKDLEIVTSIAGQAAMFIEINILAKKIEEEIVNRERFSRLLSPNVAEKVMAGELEVTKGGTLVSECTVFNSDIRGFTPMSEGAAPEAIVEMLNEYFEEMVEVLFKYEGTLDKFMGDGIMALWGAPVQHPDDPIRAVMCGLEQMEVLRRFNQVRVEQGRPALAVGIGIHTGPLVAGYIGSSKALSYTVIGDTANTSARLCGVAAAGQVLVSETTLSRLKNRFEYEELQPATLKGKEKPFPVFNIKGTRPNVQVPVELETK